MNEAMKLERENFLNAGAYERSKNRPDYANGFEPRTLNMWSGRVTFAIPQTQNGGFHERGRGPLENVLYEPGEPGGLHGVKLIVSDDHAGLKAARGRSFPRCRGGGASFTCVRMRRPSPERRRRRCGARSSTGPRQRSIPGSPNSWRTMPRNPRPTSF